MGTGATGSNPKGKARSGDTRHGQKVNTPRRREPREGALTQSHCQSEGPQDKRQSRQLGQFRPKTGEVPFGRDIRGATKSLQVHKVL